MTIFIEENDFSNAWAKAVHQVVTKGHDRIIGDDIEPKIIKDLISLIILEGNAIKQIEKKELHPRFPFRFVEEYCKEFTYNFDHSKFAYTYFDRLTNRKINQLVFLKEGLKKEIETGISSNRKQAVTWDIEKDLNNVSPPCLQYIQIRLIKDHKVEIHLTWRSRDLFSAWQANLIAIVDMINREILKPNDCKLIKLVDFCNSLHIYKHDLESAKEVKLIPVNPQLSY